MCVRVRDSRVCWRVSTILLTQRPGQRSPDAAERERERERERQRQRETERDRDRERQRER